jgi:membrane associated rhomboid family serine protease
VTDRDAIAAPSPTSVGRPIPPLGSAVEHNGEIEEWLWPRRGVLIVITLTMVVTAAQVIGRDLQPPIPVSRWLGIDRPSIGSGQVWRLATGSLIHTYGVPHLVMNMCALAVFGPPVERVLGFGRFLLAYAASSVLAWLFALYIAPSPPFLTAGGYGGASAAVFGVFGLAIVVSWRRATSPAASRYLLAATFTAMAILAVSEALNGRSLGGGPAYHISNAVHIGSLIVGMLIGLAMDNGPVGRSVTALSTAGRRS